MTSRYLLRFSYLGTYFKSSVKQKKDADITSVAGSLDVALSKFDRTFGYDVTSSVTISSRTDVGVHAIENTAHVDLSPEPRFNIGKLIETINKFFKQENIPINLRSFCQVSKDFNARKYAILRSYLYRIAVPKRDEFSVAPIPISEIDRCHFLRTSIFDEKDFQQALSIFCGIHDFTSFTGKPSKTLLNRTPVRCITSSSLYSGKSLMSSVYEPAAENFNFWDIVIEGRSFTYRQIRRMVTVALGVAQKKISLSYVQDLLDSPRYKETLGCSLVSAKGLYLLSVKYRESDLCIVRQRKEPSAEHVELSCVLEQLKSSLMK